MGAGVLRAGGVAGALALAALAVMHLAAPPEPDPRPAPADCTSAVLVLAEDVTNAERDGLRAALAQDPVVGNFAHQAREEAFERFADLWRADPDAVRPVAPFTVPEAFRVQLTDPAGYPAFRDAFAGRSGVGAVTGGCG